MIPRNVCKLSAVGALLMLLSLPGWARDNLNVFVFKEGVAQQNIQIRVGEAEKSTNEFGLAEFELEADDYEVGYYKNDELFALTEIELIKGLQSQIFLNLTRQGPEVDLDLPLAAYDQQFEQTELKKIDQGPKGALTLILKDNKSQQVISGARIFFKGYDVEASSDEEGLVNLEVAAGSYDISVIHPKYVMKVVKELTVKVDETTEQQVNLNRSDIELQEFIVTAPFVEGSLASTITELRDNDSIGEAISSEQFSKSGDSSAAGALKRVTGVTVIDDKYVLIRGLGERYSTVLLNDLHVPTPELTKRVVPLDIFPTGVIQDMKIEKTWRSDFPGTFAGGTLLIESKDIPDEDNYISGSFGLSYNGSTGSTAKHNKDNTRALPSMIIGFSENFGPLTEEVKVGETVLAPGLTATEKDALNKAMVNYRSYGLEDHTVEPGQDFSVSAGQSFKTSSGIKYGFAGTVYHKTNEKLVEGFKRYYTHIETTNEDILVRDNDIEILSIDEKQGGLISFGLDTLTGHQVKYTLLTLEETDNKTTFNAYERLDEGTEHQRTYLSYVEKDLLAHQFNGEHQIGKNEGGYFDQLVINWGIETAEANRLEPGTFEYEYKNEIGEYVVDAKKLFYLYSDLNDEVENMRLDLTLPFRFNERDNHTQFGLFTYGKTRNLDNRRFKVKYLDTLDPSDIDDALSQSNVDNGTIEILDSYKADDFYTAEQDVTAFYLKQLLSLREDLDLSIGLRMESSTQTLLVGEEAEESNLDTDDTLPSLLLTYRMNDEHQFRLAYSKTLSRPDFREFSPNRYKDPLTGYIVFGYEKLKYTTLDNIDISWEWYPSYDETVSFSVFSKTFTDPIETVRTLADEDVEISYRNAERADSSGYELSFRKKLDAYAKWLSNFFVSGNIAIIDSTIVLDKDAPENQTDQFIPYLTSDDRPMQGQSPHVYNLQFGYDNFFTRRSAIFSYNEFGERIRELGINGNPDVYEQPFKRLDFTMKWGLNDTYDEQEKKIGYTLTLKMKNLLDNKVTWTQGDATVLEYGPGRSYSLALSMKF